MKEKKGDYFDEKNAYGEGYEKYYTQDKQNQIDGMINGENIPKIGINQLTIDAIKNMVETKEKKKKWKKKYINVKWYNNIINIF